MVKDRRHQALLRFVARLTELAAAYSREELVTFRSIATREYPALVPLIDQYVRLAEKNETNVQPRRVKSSGRPRRPEAEIHLFDLLREKKLFPSNSDLAQFASRVMPNIEGRRFHKMSRADIAARIIEHLETLNGRTREALETSMREAMDSTPEKTSDRKTFFSTWEKIIKGL